MKAESNVIHQLVEFPPLAAPEFIPPPEYYSKDATVAGNDSFCVALAGNRCRVDGLPSPIRHELAIRYSSFASNEQAAHSVSLHAGARSYLSQAWDELLRLEERSYPDGKALVAWYFAAYRATGNSGPSRLFVSDPSFADQTVRAIENYWRWLFCDLSLADAGFILHCAGVARNGKAYLFAGPSGAGKSTIVGLSRGCSILSDDLVLVKKTPNGFSAYATPFFGSFPQAQKDRESYPIAGAFTLHKSHTVSIRALSTAHAVGALAACCPFLSGDVKRYQVLLPLIEQFCRSTPVRALQFRKEPSFWDIIEES